MGPATLERIAVRNYDLRFTIYDFHVPVRSWTRYGAAFFVFFLLFFGATAMASSPPIHDTPTVVLVVGAEGDPEFGTNFLHQADIWEKACARADVRTVTVGLDIDTNTNDYDRLRQVLGGETKEGSAQLWLVLIGHGTFDGKQARFNLRGPDVSAEELADWLRGFHRTLAIINTAASSAPFLTKLSATNRVVISATRSGNEQNYTRFGQYFAAALTDPQADIDHDGQISLLEAFLVASRQATDFYKVQGRLVTEHALIDDNGDGLGTPADWFKGLRAVKQASNGAALDGTLAQQLCLLPSAAEQALTTEQLAQRDALERAVFLHREKKSAMAEEEYYAELEKLLLQLARLYTSTATTNSAPAQ
jgi:hypothetical protein